jgi:hypothetical protein
VYLEMIRNSCFMKSRNPKKKNLGLRDKNLRSVSTLGGDNQGLVGGPPHSSRPCGDI